jgi:hypothetical protein
MPSLKGSAHSFPNTQRADHPVCWCCCRFRGDTADSGSTQSCHSKQQQTVSPADDFGIPPATEADGERWRELPDAVFAEVITKISAKDLG